MGNLWLGCTRGSWVTTWKQVEMLRECPIFKVAKLDNCCETAIALWVWRYRDFIIMLHDKPTVYLWLSRTKVIGVHCDFLAIAQPHVSHLLLSTGAWYMFSSL